MDIIPPNKRSIRNIPLSLQVEDEPTKKSLKEPSKSHIKELLDIEISESKNGRKKAIWFIVALAVASLAIVIVSKFATATITIIKSGDEIPLALNINLAHNSSSTDSVDYDVMTLSLSHDIPASSISLATGTAALGAKATGSVTLYNSYSAAPQIFVKDTRLTGTNGKTYFLASKVTVPGQSTVKGVVTPGTIAAKVIAEKEGASYSIDSTNFTLPGLKSSPRYKSVYAKSKTSITGGTEAKSKVVVDKQTLQDINTSLYNDAIKQLTAEKADGYILIDGATQDSLSVNSSSSASLTLSALLIKKSDLALFIQTAMNLDIKISPGNADHVIIDTSSLNINIPAGLDITKITDLNNFKISLNGTTTINSDFSDKKINDEIAGLDRGSAEKILIDKVGVTAVNLDIWPWWVSTVPSNPESIKIMLENN